MRIEKTLCDALIQLAAMNPNYYLSEDVVFKYTEQEGLTLAETTRVCKQLEEAGVRIVSQVEYDAAVSVAVSEPALPTCSNIVSVEDIITAFTNLSNSDQELCFAKIQQLISHDKEDPVKGLSSTFLERISKMPMQYSYMAVLLLAFLNNCDNNGLASFEAVIESFSSYYRARHLISEIAEQSDSVLSSPDFTNADAKRIILYNPLRRSFLAEYIKYNENNCCLEISEQLWKNLTDNDICEVRSIVKSKLDGYYSKISSKCNDETAAISTELKNHLLLHLSSKKIRAHGYYSDGKFTVLRGSQMSHDPRSSCRKNIIQEREKLLECGKVVDDIFVEDVVFGSPSTAAAVLLGGESNGWIEWKNEDGKTLKEISG